MKTTLAENQLVIKT